MGVYIRIVCRTMECLIKQRLRVPINEILSNPIEITFGVRQGSLIGLLMLLAFMNGSTTRIYSNLKLFMDYLFINYKKIMGIEDVHWFKPIYRNQQDENKSNKNK